MQGRYAEAWGNQLWNSKWHTCQPSALLFANNLDWETTSIYHCHTLTSRWHFLCPHHCRAVRADAAAREVPMIFATSLTPGHVMFDSVSLRNDWYLKLPGAFVRLFSVVRMRRPEGSQVEFCHSANTRTLDARLVRDSALAREVPGRFACWRDLFSVNALPPKRYANAQPSQCRP